MLRLAIVGDIHGHWSDRDHEHFAQLAYDRVLVVGDLAGLRWSGTLAVAQSLGRMASPAIVFPGNHDGTHPLQLLAEVAGLPTAGNRMAPLQETRTEAIAEAVAPHPLAAYSLHPLDSEVTLLAARPYSMGGPSLSFPGRLEAGWGIGDLEQSAARLCALVDEAPTTDLVILAHNGPAGLGATRDAIWGCDFRKAEGDWGDPDLEAAIAHAGRVGKRVRLVVAGHMHRKLRGGGRRVWLHRDDGVTYVNAAEVPRVGARGRHHVAVTLDEESVQVDDVWMDR